MAADIKHLILIDGSGIIFPAYHALPPMTRSDGTPVNAVFGFSNTLLKVVEDAIAREETEGPNHTAIAIILDAGRKTFRNDIYPEYKAHRPPPPEDLVPQFPLVRDAIRAFNLPAIEMAGFEADDLIATYARQAEAKGMDVTIVSSDKDLMQLVGDKVTMLDSMKNRRVGVDEVVEKFGVPPEKVTDVQALAGDSADNVPGVPGIGVKTAAELINTYGDLETLLEHAGEIKQPKRRENLVEHADLARVSKELVHLRDDVPVETPLEDFTFSAPDPAVLMAFLVEQEFNRLITRVRGKFGGDAVSSPASSAASGVPPAPPPPAPAPSKTRYEAVQTIAALEEWVAKAHAAGIVAVDTETTSLDAMTADLVGVSLSVEPGEACYIPLGHKAPAAQGAFDLGDGLENDSGESIDQIPLEKALSVLRPLLADEGVLKVGHNIKYDELMLSRYDVAVAPVDDTMVLSYVLDGGLHGHGMDELADLHLGLATVKFSDVAGTGRNKITFDLVPLEKAVNYAAEDADITLRLHQTLKPRLALESMTTLYETVERPLIPILVEMEKNGILVDARTLTGLSKDFEKRLAVLEREIHKLAGREFSVASPKQLGEVLFDEMGLAGGKRGKSGQYATGADVLEELAAAGHDLPQKVLDWRQLAKLKSTYTDALLNQINPRTGRVHTSFAMAATSTGRLASSDPNLQNIPVRTEEGRKIRGAFIADKGHTLLSVDYSQIELRLLAHVAEIDTLRQAFIDGADIHAMTASEIFGVPMAKMDAETRRRAKAINFGIIYGISPFGLARQLGISNGEAKEYIDVYFARYPGIRDYMEARKEEAREKGFVTTLFGRKCYAPGIHDKNPARRQFAERAAINAPLQGSAADIIKRAMIRGAAALKDKKSKARMLLQVHDELLFEVPEKDAEKTAKLVKDIMEGAAEPAITLSVPVVADIGMAKTWAKAH